MVYSATPPSAEDVHPQGEVARELERVVALLEGDKAGAVTIAALLERGVQEPAQAVYGLQLAGYAMTANLHRPAQEDLASIGGSLGGGARDLRKGRPADAERRAP